MTSALEGEGGPELLAGWVVQADRISFLRPATLNEQTEPSGSAEGGHSGEVPAVGELTGETPAEGEPTGETPAEGEPSGETPAEGEPSGETPAEGEPTGETPAEGEPGGETPTEGGPSGETPAEGEPGGETPTEGEPTGETPAEGEPSGETPAEGEPGGETPAEGEPTGETPAEGEPTGETPAEGEPGGETPAEGEPGGETPAEGEATGETPTEGEPAGEGAGEELPGEDGSEEEPYEEEDDEEFVIPGTAQEEDPQEGEEAEGEAPEGEEDPEAGTEGGETEAESGDEEPEDEEPREEPEEEPAGPQSRPDGVSFTVTRIGEDGEREVVTFILSGEEPPAVSEDIVVRNGKFYDPAVPLVIEPAGERASVRLPVGSLCDCAGLRWYVAGDFPLVLTETAVVTLPKGLTGKLHLGEATLNLRHVVPVTVTDSPLVFGDAELNLPQWKALQDASTQLRAERLSPEEGTWVPEPLIAVRKSGATLQLAANAAPAGSYRIYLTWLLDGREVCAMDFPVTVRYAAPGKFSEEEEAPEEPVED